MKAGVAELTITPDGPVPLWGYGGRTDYSIGVHDDIYARAFVFEADKRFLLITLDIGGIDYDIYKRAVTLITGSVDIAPEAIAINTTHTHAGPGVVPMRGMDVDERYEQYLIKRIAEAARIADRNVSEVLLEYGTTSSFLALNRRENPRVSDWDLPSGTIDSELNLLLVRNKSSRMGKLSGAIVHYAAHPVTLRNDNYLISADYPGVVCRELYKSFGCPVTFLQGTSGNTIPKIFGTYYECDEFGVRLAEDTRKALMHLNRVEEDTIAFAVEEIEVPYAPPYTLEDFQTEYDKVMTDPVASRRESWAQEYMAYLKAGKYDLNKTSIVQAARIGNLGFTFLPGEILNHTGMDIKKAMKPEKIIVAAYSNDISVGYLPPAEEYPKGKYEVETAWKFYGLLQPKPEAEQLVEDTSVKLLQSLFV